MHHIIFEVNIKKKWVMSFVCPYCVEMLRSYTPGTSLDRHIVNMCVASLTRSKWHHDFASAGRTDTFENRVLRVEYPFVVFIPHGQQWYSSLVAYIASD